jgi:hypothetical protein
MIAIWYELLPVTLKADHVVWLHPGAVREAHPWHIARLTQLTDLDLRGCARRIHAAQLHALDGLPHLTMLR